MPTDLYTKVMIDSQQIIAKSKGVTVKRPDPIKEVPYHPKGQPANSYAKATPDPGPCPFDTPDYDPKGLPPNGYDIALGRMKKR
jgi:hypothetical protein